MNRDLLRSLPRVDDLADKSKKYIERIEREKDYPREVNSSLLVQSARKSLEAVRKGIIEGTIGEMPGEREMMENVSKEYYEAKDARSLRKVINATGITLHTNFGRAPISKEAAKAAYDAAICYTNLEYDLETGERGSRYSHVERLICEMTGCESALVVNNNAAAVMLILHALGYGRNMLISRGELVEIGGSFRIPAIMEISGVTLSEVGTTNRTKLEDYEEALNYRVAAILKVHTSNFVINGFTQDVGIEELAKLAGEKKIPLIYDMGSGDWENHKDASLCDVVCFSADKVMGGPQAGIICGKKSYIDKIKKDNLLRTVRLDKMTLAALEVTLMAYCNDEKDSVVVNRLLNMTGEEMHEKASKLIDTIMNKCTCDDITMQIVTNDTRAGGGSRPDIVMEDVCIAISIGRLSAEEIARGLRCNPIIPIIGRIHNDEFLMSVRTIFEEDYEIIAKAISKLKPTDKQLLWVDV